MSINNSLEATENSPTTNMALMEIRNVPYSRVDCSGNEKKYVCEVIDSGWLTTASRTMELESKFRELLDVKHAIAVNSCTAGLHLALEATGVKPDSGVFCPTLTFTASAEVIRYVGAHPVLLDIDPCTYSLSPELFAEAIAANPEVKHMIAVHYGGRALEMRNSAGTGIADQCEKHGIQLVEDAAHALPARQGSKMVGNIGDLTCFSFYANKTMTTGEGGMVVTNSDAYADRIRMMRLHGIDRDVWDRFTKKNASWEYDVLAPGFKYNLPDLAAAVGLAQFERLEEMRAERQRCAQYYYDTLQAVDGIELPERPESFEDHAWHLFPICMQVRENFSRNEFKDELEKLGVGTSVHYKPVHRLTYYKDTYSFKAENYPGAEAIWNSTISLPIYNTLSDADLGYVCDAIKLVASRHAV